MNKIRHLLKLIALLYFFAIVNLSANNLSVSNVSTTGQNTTSDYILVEFDISWENSFRDATNWDAAWVFVKYETTDGLWHHATLNTTDGNHTAPSGSTINTSSDGLGAFIYRSSTSTGTFSLTDAQLRWEYGSDSVGDAETVTIKVFAIEMVYVPTGSFELGDGDGTSESLYSFHSGTTDNNVTISASLTSDIRCDANSNDDSQLEDDGIGIDGDGGIDVDDDGVIDNADFPTGYNAFYCMKYEVTQGQFIEFMNTLTFDQQANHASFNTAGRGAFIWSPSPVDRITVEVVDEGTDNTVPVTYGLDLNDNDIYNESDDGQNIACGALSFGNMIKYLDWAGLRLMTELEYEKACRGDQSAVVNEFAWGTADFYGTDDYTLSDPGAANEGIATNYSTTSEGNMNAQQTGAAINGPVRVGIFAANSSNSGRVTSGASYYGIMELSGNQTERCITVGNSTGRAYTGEHGDGDISTNETNWPTGGSGVGAGYRGGQWNLANYKGRVSRREHASLVNVSRGNSRGIRGVRTAE